MKKFLAVLLAVALLVTMGITTFAQETLLPSSAPNPVGEPKSLFELGADRPTATPFSMGELSEPKSKTKSVYTQNSGYYMGTVTLDYRTVMVGGRPQFAYDYCYISYDFSQSEGPYESYYDPNVEFTSDKITAIFVVQYHMLTDKMAATFTP